MDQLEFERWEPSYMSTMELRSERENSCWIVHCVRGRKRFGGAKSRAIDVIAILDGFSLVRELLLKRWFCFLNFQAVGMDLKKRKQWWMRIIVLWQSAERNIEGMLTILMWYGGRITSGDAARNFSVSWSWLRSADPIESVLIWYTTCCVAPQSMLNLVRGMSKLCTKMMRKKTLKLKFALIHRNSILLRAGNNYFVH